MSACGLDLPGAEMLGFYVRAVAAAAAVFGGFGEALVRWELRGDLSLRSISRITG